MAGCIGRMLAGWGLAAAVGLAGMGGARAGEGTGMEAYSPEARTVLAAIHARRSVRTFTGEPVTREQLDAVLRAAMAAPSGKDARPWVFVAIDDRATLDALAAGLRNASMLKGAAAAVVVCGDMAKNGVEGTDYWVVDGALASENLLLAASAMGLGGVYTAAWPYADRMAHIAKTLGLPDTVRPLCVIPLGHSAGKEQPKDKWNPGLVHWNRWGGAAEGAAAAEAPKAPTAGEKVPFEAIPPATFAAFLRNWEPEGAPLYAVIRTPEDWNRYFSPAVVMGNTRPVAPDPAFFQTRQLLVVAMVAAAGDGQPVLTPLSLKRTDDGTVLTYRITQPPEGATHRAKHVLLLAVDKDVPGPFTYGVHF